MYISEEKFDIGVKENKLTLVIKRDHQLSIREFKIINDMFKGYLSQPHLINQLEVDFSNTIFDISAFAEKLIRKSYLVKNRKLRVILKLAKHNLPSQLNCFHFLKKFNVYKYRIDCF